ncbi:MAG TPA: type I glyceraldehyde-3-phosphate dehydrogenase [Candidatus Nanoarchaeia archaeon]|nr:type I glyceraldehyde-3-phosphate dehydrogenase [Candidatus Nanoarchaeia archaeon]
MVNIAINGFGRIGKKFFLACLKNNVNWNFIINDLSSIENLAYLLKYDTIHYEKIDVKTDKEHLIVNGKKIKVYSIKDPALLPWKAEKIDLVVDCTGFYTKGEDAKKHLDVGAKRVLISAPAKGHDITVVYGVNDEKLKKEHKIVSAGSCTTNCISPMVKILNDKFKIKKAHFVTTHAYTATQRLIDGIDNKDLRRGRAASQNIIPSTSGASQSVIEAIPDLKGKLQGYALRVPVVDGSISTVVAELGRKTTVEEINSLFKSMSQKEYKKILAYTEEQLVSTDIHYNPASCTFDSALTFVNENLVSIAGWYDNEWGYSNRLVDVAKMLV